MNEYTIYLTQTKLLCEVSHYHIGNVNASTMSVLRNLKVQHSAAKCEDNSAMIYRGYLQVCIYFIKHFPPTQQFSIHATKVFNN